MQTFSAFPYWPKFSPDRRSYMGDMPWLSIPFDSKARGTAAQLLGVTALPTLLVFDENEKLITANGRAEIIRDQQGENFPWYPKVCVHVGRR